MAHFLDHLYEVRSDLDVSCDKIQQFESRTY